MDRLILQLEELTNNLMGRLDEATYEEMEQFIVERQKVINSIEISLQDSTVTQQQKERALLLLKYDSAIMSRIQTLMNEARDWLQQRNTAKVQRNMYSSSYTPDSILMDQRK